MDDHAGKGTKLRCDGDSDLRSLLVLESIQKKLQAMTSVSHLKLKNFPILDQGIVEAQQQLKYCTLAASTGSHESHRLPSLQSKLSELQKSKLNVSVLYKINDELNTSMNSDINCSCIDIWTLVEAISTDEY